MGIGHGDWGLGIGDWGLGPIPNPQSPFRIKFIIILIYIFSFIKYLKCMILSKEYF